MVEVLDDDAVAGRLPGDADMNGVVGGSDYGILMRQFGLSVVAAAATSVDPGTTSDQSGRLATGENLTAKSYGNGVAPCFVLRTSQDRPRDVKAAPGRRTPNNDAAAGIDLLMPLPSALDNISVAQAISGGLSAPRLHRAATATYDLRPLGDGPASDAPGDDLLADVLEEAVLLAVRL